MLYFIPMPMVFPTGHHHGEISPEALLWMFAISVVLTLLYIYLLRHRFKFDCFRLNRKTGKYEPVLKKVPIPKIIYLTCLICVFIPCVNIAAPLTGIIVFFTELGTTTYDTQTDLKFINWLIK